MNRQLVIAYGQRVFLQDLFELGISTAEHVRDLVPLPEGMHPTVFAEVPKQLEKAGVIARAGFVLSRRTVRHKAPVSLWRIVDRRAAQAWHDRLPILPKKMKTTAQSVPRQTEMIWPDLSRGGRQ